MIEKGVYSRLAADTTLAPLVSTSDSPALIKIFANRVDQEIAPPFVRFFRIFGRRPDTLAGHNGWTQAGIQVDCYAKTYGEVKAMADAVRLSLDGYKGAMGSQVAKACRMTGEREGYHEDAELHLVQLDFNIWYVEATS
jgi:hypothetical protein